MGLEIRRFCVRYDAADTAAARAAELFSEELRDRGVTPAPTATAVWHFAESRWLLRTVMRSGRPTVSSPFQRKACAV